MSRMRSLGLAAGDAAASVVGGRWSSAMVAVVRSVDDAQVRAGDGCHRIVYMVEVEVLYLVAVAGRVGNGSMLQEMFYGQYSSHPGRSRVGGEQLHGLHLPRIEIRLQEYRTQGQIPNKMK